MRSLLMITAAILLTGCTKKSGEASPPPIWEKVAGSTVRMETPRGWVVFAGTGVCYVPDPDHKWVLR